MALITSFTLIRVLAVLHITMGFYFMTAPRQIADQNMVVLLGESMKLPRTYAFDKPTPVTALLGLVFAFIGLTDLIAVSMREHIALEYWSSQAPVRALFFFVLTGYVYVFKADPNTIRSFKSRQTVGAQLENGLVFTWGFVEVLIWFWAYTKLREERRVSRVDRRAD